MKKRLKEEEESLFLAKGKRIILFKEQEKKED